MWPETCRCRGITEAAAQLGLRHAAGELEQPEGIAARLRDDSIAHPFVDVTGDDVVEEGTSVLVAESLEGQLGEIGEQALRSHFPHREDQQHRFGEESPSDELQRVTGGLVEPLRVVDQTDQRLRRRRPRPGASTRRGRRGTGLELVRSVSPKAISSA